ncbi:MAG: hypothetical protein WCA77_05205 [Thermoplasmata archaeon]
MADTLDARRGLPSGDEPDHGGWAAALLIALGVVLIIEWFLTQQPIPSGSDEGRWLTYGYAFVGLHFPPQSVPIGYAPISFPILGAAVGLTGSPVTGSLAYVGITVIALGASVYYLGTTILYRRALALLLEGLVLFEPGFMRLVFFGSYPFLLSFVFLVLAVAFALRFLKSGRTGYLLAFWAAVSATVLTHSLAAAVVVGFIVVFGLFLLIARRLPREVFTSGYSIGGILLFITSVGGYYGLTWLLHIPHPTYLNVGSTTSTLVQAISPFHVGLIISLVHHGVKLTPAVAFDIIIGLIVFILLVLLICRAARPQWLSLSVLALAAWGIVPMGGAAVGYLLHIATDFSRFAYVLYIPLIAGGVLTADFAIRWYLDELPTGTRPFPWGPTHPAGFVSSDPAVVSTARPRPRSASAAVAVAAIAAVIVVLLASLVSVPAFQADELQYTAIGHDSEFLQTIHALQNAGVPGSVITDSTQTDKWVAALTNRNTYLPLHAGTFDFTPSVIRASQMAHFAVTAHWVATNGLMVAQVNGLSTGNFVGAPSLGIYYDGYAENILGLNPSELAVLWAGTSTPVPVYDPTTQVVVSLPSNAPVLVVSFLDANLTVTTTTVLNSGSASGTTAVSAVAAAGHELEGLSASLTNLPLATLNVTQTGTSDFSLTTFGYGGHIGINAVMRPGTTGVVQPGKPTSTLTVSSRSSSAIGNTSLGLSFAFSAPESSNPIKTLPAVMTAPQLWATWNTRWVLLLNNPIETRTAEFLSTEFGTLLYYANTQYLLIELPAPSL